MDHISNITHTSNAYAIVHSRKTPVKTNKLNRLCEFTYYFKGIIKIITIYYSNRSIF